VYFNPSSRGTRGSHPRSRLAFEMDNGWPAWTPSPNITPALNVGAISRELSKGYVLDLTYTGNKGTHLESGQVNVMQIAPQYAYLGSLLNQPITSPAVAALGFKAPFPSFVSVLGKNATLGQSLRLFPQYSGLASAGQGNHSGNSTYEALVIKVTKRYSGGLALVGSYTWSKLLTDADDTEPWIGFGLGAGRGNNLIGAQNQYNRNLEKSYSVLDTPSMLKITVSYDFPFGKGKAYLANGVLGRIIGNWNIGAYIFGQSGYPMAVTDTGYRNNLFGGTPRPNVLTSNWLLPYSGTFDPSVDKFLDPSAFARRTNPAADPFGNAPVYNGASRFFPLYGENISGEHRYVEQPVRSHRQRDREPQHARDTQARLLVLRTLTRTENGGPGAHRLHPENTFALLITFAKLLLLAKSRRNPKTGSVSIPPGGFSLVFAYADAIVRRGATRSAHHQPCLQYDPPGRPLRFGQTVQQQTCSRDANVPSRLRHRGQRRLQ
jgi:hypothetical protein